MYLLPYPVHTTDVYLWCSFGQNWTSAINVVTVKFVLKNHIRMMNNNVLISKFDQQMTLFLGTMELVKYLI